MEGKIPDPRNLYRDCERKGMMDPRRMTRDDLGAEMIICDQKLEELKLTAPGLRVEHLKARIEAAEKRGNLEAAEAIEKMLKREALRKRMNRLRYTTKPNRGGAVYSVRVQDDTDDSEYNTEDEIFGKVSSHLAQRFRLAFSAPCHRGQLFDDIGFLGDTAAARDILQGAYEFPPDTDPATRLLLEEAAHTYAKMSQEEIATYVTVDELQDLWQRKNERILPSSSYGTLENSCIQ